jgi:Fur family ferric uptake transcriptional regulator
MPDSSAATVLAHPPRGPRAAGGIAEFAPACAILRRHLKGQKLKFTPERAQILEVVLNQDHLFEAEQLADEVKAAGGGASRATVYRTLGHLADAGIVRQVHLDRQKGYFELLAGREPSDYIVDADSGEVTAFRDDRLQQLCKAIAAEHGYDVMSHQFQIVARRL